MKFPQTVVSIVLLALCLYLASAEKVDFEKCPVRSDRKEKCTIHSVSITPCPGAEKGPFCTIYSGSNVTITFDFTPLFAADTLTIFGFLTTPNFDYYQIFKGVNIQACENTNCPLVAGNQQTYTHNFQVENSIVPERYTVTWKMTNENEDYCCLTVPIEISNRTNLD